MLVSKPHKKLLLNLNNPERVTALIPTAKVATVKGKDIVVVPHREDEVRVLRNIGIDAPAPMGYYYDWPGRYKPFAHQKATGEFLSMNPHAFCLNGLGCISGDAKVRVSRKGKSQEMRLDELHKKFHSLPDKDSWKVRSLMGGRFGMNQLLDVLNKGVKPTLRIELEDGKVFNATSDHSIARPDGTWTNAGDLVIGDELVTNGRVMLTCPECGVEREVDKYYAQTKRTAGKSCRACKYAKHSAAMMGENNPSWNGGRFIDADGYVKVVANGHHRADNGGYVYEHILVAESTHGIVLDRSWHVHHINGIKCDNRPENLAVLPESVHHRHHDPRLKLDGAVSAKGGVVVVLPKRSKIVSISDGGMLEVFDLCMQAPHNNFVVNGVVVHNSGKTMSVLWAFDYLRKQGTVRKMLVISPLSTLERTWGDEIFRNMIDYSFAVVHGTRDKRNKLLAADHDIYIINHDGIKSEDTMAAILARDDIDLVVVDEIASFRNSSTDRWKALNLLVNGSEKKGIPPKEWVWGLTGTPTPNEPTDAWAQIRLISPSRVPKYFGHFRDKVMRQVTQFKWSARDNAATMVSEVMQPAIRFATEDCVDLPPTTYLTRQADLTSEQRKAYKEMLNQLHTEVGTGQITAVNEAVKLNKLVQILCLKYDTNVLTDRGWIEIQSILPSDMVWDGVEWVGHGGVVFNGVRQVVDCAGVWCTEDHLVLSSCGWVTAKEFINGNASKRLDWAEVRLPGGCEPSGFKKGRQELRGDLELPVRLRKHSGSVESVPANETQDAPPELWVPPRQRNAQVVKHDATPHVVRGQGEVSQSSQPGLAKLRRAWDFYVRQVAGVVHEFFGRHGWLIPRWADIGADEQRRTLLPRELQVGDTGRTVQQQAHKHLVGYRAWSNDHIPSCSGVRSAGDNTSGASAQVQVAAGESPEYPCEAVYDITNCGPRNQFVVMGADGHPRIVHNCGVAYGSGDSGHIEIPAGPRIDLVREVVEQAAAKVIVFVPLTGALNMLAKELSKDFTVEVVHGGTSKADRDRIFKDFQNSKDPRVLVANPSAMSHGITLTAANVTVWYAPTTSNEVWLQANARTVRPGQKLKTFIVQIEGSDIERKMYERLQSKTKMQGLLLDLVRDAN